MNKYKIILSGRTVYKEIDLPFDAKEIRIGTETSCDFRLRKDLFFDKIELFFVNRDNNWSLMCRDNLYIDTGDFRKLGTKQLNHGDIFTIKYHGNDNEVFSVEFVIDFDNGQRKYERAINVSASSIIRIGNGNSNDIAIFSPFVKNDSLELRRTADGFMLQVHSTTYGVYHNGTKIAKSCSITNGDFFSVSDFIFYYSYGYLWTEISDNISINGLMYADYPNPQNYPKFVRNSRIHRNLNSNEIQILDPPTRPEKPENNLLMTLLPSFGMLLTSGAMAMMGNGGMIIMSAMSGGLAVVTAILSIIQSKKDYKKNFAKITERYNEYINSKREEISNLRNTERTDREEIYISSEVELERLFSFSPTLFDRTPADEDFLSVRLGTGDIEAARKINFKKQEKMEADDDLQVLPEQLYNENKLLLNAPVVCSFKDINAISLVGTEQNRFELFKNIVLDICTRQYHTDVELMFIAEEKNKDRISWLRMLPNVSNPVTGMRNIICDDESKNRILDYLYKELTNREGGVIGKHIVVFLYDEYGFKNHPISKFVEKAKDLGVTFVFMVDTKGDAPVNCDYLALLASGTDGTLIDIHNMENSTGFKFNPIDDQTAAKIVNFLAPVYTEEVSLEGTLTKNISLFELLNILSADDIDLEQRWNTSQVFKSMSAPLGVAKSGLICLDLHDKAHGPHGLVAGTTGSGKSEILQTYILSIATLFHPYEVSFVIIDFKGGGMVNQFKDLPHLLGAITNIDGKEIDRSLKSIKAELQKRQRLFAEAEVNHIDKYIKKYKAGEVETPIPHLIVIVDEFAELKAEQPDFMKELISAARIGRSLGVHLILATQKPSGQVDDQIWSNSRFKLCLKVQSKEDSNEVLKSPLAAEIKEPGRAYLQVGNNEVFELFQSAYSGAPEKMSDGNVKEFSVFSVSETGKKTPVFVQKKQKDNSSDNLTQLEAIVNYVHNYCEQRGIASLPNICLPPLPSVINCPETAVKSNGCVDIGLFDDPDNQLQASTMLDIDNKNTLIIGSSQYGKTNLLQSLIKAITKDSSPEESAIYILDFGSMVLKNFEALNHVGGVVCSSDDEKLKNLFKLLFNEIAQRKEKLVSVGVSSFSSYLEAGYTDIPHIYLFVDNLTALMELYLEDDDSLLSIIREGISVGITVIVANSQTAGIGYKYISNFANKITLYCNDSNEYGNVFDHVTLKPDEKPGRCVLEIDKRMLESQTYLAFNGEKEIDRVREMQQFIAEVNEKYKGLYAAEIPCIPTVLTEESLYTTFKASVIGYRLPIGLTYSDVEPFSLDLSQVGILGLCGKEGTGHRNFISFIINTLRYNPNTPANIVIFDDINRKFAEFKNNVDRYILGLNDVEEVFNEWCAILEQRYDNLVANESLGDSPELLLMIIQNNDVAKKINDDFDTMNRFTDIMTRFKGMNVCIIFSNYPNSTISYDAPEPIRMVKQEQHLLFFDNLDNLKTFDVSYDDLRANKKRVETGDGYYIEDNVTVKLKLVKADE